MLTLKTLRVLNRMSTAYPHALDRRCRAASGYTGKGPGCDVLVTWAGEAVEVQRLTRRLAAFARLPAVTGQRRAMVAALLAASEQRRVYYAAYAAVAGTILRHIDPKLIPLMQGAPQNLLAVGRRRANDYRFLLLQDQFDSAPVEIDDDRLEYRVGIDELLPLVEPRRFARRLHSDAGMAALHLGCLLGLIGVSSFTRRPSWSACRANRTAEPGSGLRAH